MLSVSDGENQVIAKPRVEIIFSFTFTSDQIEGVCFSFGELLIFPENISPVSELHFIVLYLHHFPGTTLERALKKF